VSAQPGSESDAVPRSATDNAGRTRLPTIAYHAVPEVGFDSGSPITLCSWKSNDLRDLHKRSQASAGPLLAAPAYQAGTPMAPFGTRRPFNSRVP
jgi:hypothetical protein